jgi:hypothetical protein
VTPPDDRVRRLANAGCSARGIAAETGLSRRQVDRVLATMADELGSREAPAPLESSPAEPAPPDLEPPPPPPPAPAPPAAPDLTPKERDRAATAARIAESKARLEAESARDNMRDVNPLRDAMRAARWRKPI